MNDKITFSVDRFLTKMDLEESSALAEEFFDMEDDPNQIPASEENKRFILENIPECDNVIRVNGRVVGFTFIVPCNNEIMSNFLTSKITEKQLFEEVKKRVNYDNFETIYLCSSFVKDSYRGRGLSAKGWVGSIKKITEKRKIKPVLFGWVYTDEGKGSMKKVADQLGLELKLK